MGGALDGILVADFSRVLAGPYATMLLGDLGATVVKVERPSGGDDTRGWGPPWGPDGQSTYFTGVNRNKKSLALDLTTSQDNARARALARQADIVISNFAPGTMEHFGLGYAEVCASNPDVIYCSISGFGNGPGAHMPGYDLMVQAMGGLMSITGTAEPTKAGVAVVDVITGLHAGMAILAALHHRDVTGVGQNIDVSLLSALLSGLVNQSAAFAGGGVVAAHLGNAHPSIAPYEVYNAHDRGFVLAVGNDAQFASLSEAIGHPELASDERFATNSQRVVHREDLNALLVPIFAERSVEEWHSLLLERGIPNGPINDIAGAVTLAAKLGLDPLVAIPTRADPQQHITNPVRYSQTEVSYPLPAPALSEHTDALIEEFNLDEVQS
jgi:crotonobetainyl-CoA:carnitine CoA-transferase CaiB-like acyl-CoA transferase